MKVIHDGDAAYEDIIALSLLLLNADVVAVTVTYGESTPHIGAANMERICRMLRPDVKIPVAFGVNFALDFHGEPFPEFIKIEEDSILESTEVPLVTDSQVTDSAVHLLYNTLMVSHEKITILATGPLTNIAELVSTYPECIEKIEKIVIMGGAVHVPGNITDLIFDATNTVAEWNIYADPKAAEIVFNTPLLPMVLVPLDITRQMPMTRDFYARLEGEVLPALRLVRHMLTSLLQTMGEDLFYEKLQFWDSLAAMITLNPAMAQFEELSLTVDLNTSQVIENTTLNNSSPKVQIATTLIDIEKAYDTFLTLMKKRSKSSSMLANYDSHFFSKASSNAPSVTSSLEFKPTTM
ncbi:inosine-uridine preferring nucleoside hydrolase [Legionella beliardensis]|uniref:Inosine-uridine preferring nucleoside hydrolase n=1 Tax=Legionella beliardensis TaxID=91822 RepID=A0A378HZX8_9GAMM|nr:nucleoside hydrolase [Legionella beliardensis]STX28497.1 inosine-uridine preferring nucleoside hydrolase [Legionella beliardensis]